MVGKSILGRYAVHRVLGVGGKGTVYEAEDAAMERVVAIKVPTETHEDTIKRFLREGRAGASIAHPNVCAIYDFGPLEDGTPFLVMERLEGETLADRLSRTPQLRLAEALPIIQQVLAGLGAAHARGIIHRDVKPGNVFLTQQGPELVAKLLDFGASTLDRPHARKEDDFEMLTKVGMAIGTPIYMTPEQIRGQRDLDARVDVYACGVILYEALTGILPFAATRRNELFRLIVEGQARRACEIEPRLPKAMDVVLGRAMAGNREDRYPNVEAFSNALESLRIESMRLSIPTPLMLPEQGERLKVLQQRLAEVSSLYLPSETKTQTGVQSTRPSTLDIPILVEEEPPPLPSIARDEEEPEFTPTRRDPPRKK